MKIPLYQVDAFTDEVFSGNPAAVCPLQSWLPDNTLQAIAAENNLSETAFFVNQDNQYHLRWFTPATEVDLCGHATLATAHVLFNILQYDQATIEFQTRSGPLRVRRYEDGLEMDFPAQPPEQCEAPGDLHLALGQQALEVWQHEDMIAVYETESQVVQMTPDFRRIAELDVRGVIITAPGDKVDFVSRFFAPRYGIDEDPVTGSAHCQLVPYWAQRLGKNRLVARQVSNRGGDLLCQLKEQRVTLFGKAVKFMQGEIDI